GWDNVLPRWFSKLHRGYKTPTNSILFVGAVTLLFAIGSLLGVGAQEAFQLIDNAAGIFYAIAYLVLFAVPVIGLRGISARAPLWLRIAAVIGALVTLLYIVFTVIPIVPVQSRIGFAARVVGTVVISNLIGALIFVTGERRQRARARANA
ncbi:MAG: amino acid permease, partial [Chthoniobacterales bacterium]